MKARKTTKLVHEGRYAAEVEVELLEDEHEWAPYLSMADAKKLDEMRLALREGNLKVAARLGRVYELKPVAAE
jgi:anti-sigma28 factor (negative regulator of flagellin synthesis)